MSEINGSGIECVIADATPPPRVEKTPGFTTSQNALKLYNLAVSAPRFERDYMIVSLTSRMTHLSVCRTSSHQKSPPSGLSSNYILCSLNTFAIKDIVSTIVLTNS